MTQKGVVNALPKLPGFAFPALSQPATFNMPGNFDVYQGLPLVRSATDDHKSGAVEDVQFSRGAIAHAFPEWSTFDNKVLRFFGYFTETIAESAIERMRVRKVVVLYYLNDNTICVNENALCPNSGMRGGSVMSRHQDESVLLRDLKIGSWLTMRSKSIMLVDVDAFTRDFFAKMGFPQGAAMDYPPDTFEKLQSKKADARPAKDEDHIAMNKVSEMLAAAAMGKPAASTSLSYEERQKAQNFLKHDREVLTFFAVWDKRNFRINYFLADGTMSVTELHAPNTGRDPNRTFIKRGVIPNGEYQLKPIDTVCVPRGGGTHRVTETDLIVGNSITLFGRTFSIYSCDPYTRQYYQETHRLEQGDLPKPWTEGDAPISDKPVRDAPIPPPNGFGSDEDSLGSVKHMVPQPPKKDYAKYIKHANDVLRFSAELANPAPEDEGRDFIVCFYLADDTVSVYEYPGRNSGHVGGKVFARAKVPTVSMEDMNVGRELKLGGHVFRLIGVDDRTEKYVKSGISMGVSESTKAEELLARARSSITQKWSRINEAYRHFNVTKKGMSIADLKSMLRECEVKVDDDDIVAQIMQLCDTDRDGVISLQEFVENVLKLSLTTKPSPDASSSAGRTFSTFHAIEEDKRRREFADAVFKSFITKLEARRAFIVDTFRIVSDRSIDGLIGVDTFRNVITTRLGLEFTQEELDALVYRFYYVAEMPEYLTRRLSLREFRKIVEQ